MATDTQLSSSVEKLLLRICAQQSLPPPDHASRLALAEVGEAASLRILEELCFRRIRNFSAYIMFMCKNVKVMLARNAEVISTQESACCSSPVIPCSASNRDDGVSEATSPASRILSLPERAFVSVGSPVLKALGDLEFRQAFLILSYCGEKIVEDLVSKELIKRLKGLPMASFEREVWNAFGHRCIPESERRKNVDWNSGQSPHVYHCHVSSNGKITFKGPYSQNTWTHLQRLLGDDNILLVKFAEEKGKNSAFSYDRLCTVYLSIAKDGIVVGLRHYRFFVFKDGGKEEKKKNPTSSAVKCYFVRTESLWAMDQDKLYVPHNKSISELRTMFMHVHTVSTLAKYMPRFSLILSKTIKLEVDLASVHINVIDDIPCRDEHGQVVYNEDDERMIHTDGTGLISFDLALICPRNVYKGHCLSPNDLEMEKILDGINALNRASTFQGCNFWTFEPPLLIQCRLFNNGCAVKGTLLVNKKLPSRTICIRPSMIKVKADPDALASQTFNSLEIVGTSYQPKKTCLSRSLVALLHYGGVPKEYFLELLRNAIEDLLNARFNKRSALRVSLRYGDMDDYLVSRMILCGTPLDEPYLLSRLLVLLKAERKGLIEGRIPINDCYYLMGTADPTGTLKHDEVCVILDNGQVSGDVLVYKHPGLHFGDIHRLTATFIKGLEDIIGNSKYGIFFPVKGRRSLADEIANSDLDGDMYWVSRNLQLLAWFTPSEPWVRPPVAQKTPQPKPTQFSGSQLETELFQQFLMNRFNPSYAISEASICWMVFMDRLLTLGDDCFEEKQHLQEKIIRLVNIYYDALDAPKTGQKVEVARELKAEQYPHFMGRAKSYISKSILGILYDHMASVQEEDLPNAVWLMPCFSEEVPELCLRTWRKRYSDYRTEMKDALSGPQEYKDKHANEVIFKYKQLLYGAAELEESTRRREDVFTEAIAIYQIAYGTAKAANRVSYCSFPWRVAGRALCLLLVMKQEKDPTFLCLRSVLREVFG